MSAPDIILLTPNGRFELGKKVIAVIGASLIFRSALMD
jgi:hypothetical protein